MSVAGDHFSVDPDSVRAAARRLRGQGEALRQALIRAQSGLPATSSMCGDDEQGLSFSADYRPKVGHLEKNVQDMVTALSRMADGLEAMADNYESADATSQVH